MTNVYAQLVRVNCQRLLTSRVGHEGEKGIRQAGFVLIPESETAAKDITKRNELEEKRREDRKRGTPQHLSRYLSVRLKLVVHDSGEGAGPTRPNRVIPYQRLSASGPPLSRRHRHDTRHARHETKSFSIPPCLRPSLPPPRHAPSRTPARPSTAHRHARSAIARPSLCPSVVQRSPSLDVDAIASIHGISTSFVRHGRALCSSSRALDLAA